MFDLFLLNSQATQRLGYLFGRFLPAGSTILLEGDLGAGKTTFVQGIGKGLGVEELIVSPTFTLINEYLDGRLPLYHLDLYRLESSQVDSLYPEIYWEGVEVVPGIVAIEWQQRLMQKPSHYIEIELSFEDERSRNELALTDTMSQSRRAIIKIVGQENYDLNFLQDFEKS